MKDSNRVPGSWQDWLFVGGLSLLWIQFIWFLRYSWDPDSSYNYGWLVPVLGILLVVQNLQGSDFTRTSSNKGMLATLATLGAASVIVFLGSRLLIEINPFWRFPLWTAGLALVAITFLSVQSIWGWKCSRRLIYPLLFALTMIPWPLSIELRVIETFTGIVTQVSVASLRWLGHPAEQLGNIIRIGNSMVGVEEACSGIKSLQALGMMALFLGEYWRMSIKGRSLIIATSIVLSCVFNFFRTLTLSLIVINISQEAFDKWHDTVGHIAFGLSLCFLFAIAFQLKKDPQTPQPERSHSPSTTGTPRIAFSVVLILVAISPFAAARLWYGSTSENSDEIDWAIDTESTRSNAFSMSPLPIHERIAKNLGYDYGYHFAIEANHKPIEGELWYYGFDGDSKGKSLSAYAHSPSICMTSSGARLIKKVQPISIDLGSLTLPFQHFVFELPNGEDSQVFWCLWDDLLKGQTSEIEGDFRLAQLTAAFERERSFKRKVALIGISTSDTDLARLEIKQLVRDIFLLKKGDETFSYQ